MLHSAVSETRAEAAQTRAPADTAARQAEAGHRPDLTRLHATHGNQGVLRMSSCGGPVQHLTPSRPSQTAPPRPAHTSAGAPVPGFVQAKLILSQPGDVHELEAERVAEQVTRMPDGPAPAEPLHVTPASAAPARRAQAECAGRLFRQVDDDNGVAQDNQDGTAPEVTGEVDEEDDTEPDETGMPKREDGVSGPPPATAEELRVGRSAGRPLDPAARAFMEPRFGIAFDDVTVHTDAAAVESARHLHARAYTVGHDIYFNEGQYAPGGGEGRKLLAHELTHVLQQSAGGAGGTVVARKPAGKAKGGNVCASGGCPQGKQKKAVRDDCGESEPADPDNFITNLSVSLSAQTVDVTWSNGKTETWPCSPKPSVTPTAPDVVGVKCSIKHTNRKRDGMAWFTGFANQGLTIGFHDSQHVGKGIHSHGCVRVCCDKAEIINKNTWSGKTTISVSS